MSGEKKFLIGTGVVTILIFIVIIFSFQNQKEASTNNQLATNESTQSTQSIGEAVQILGASHVARDSVIKVSDDPPTSGDHYGDGVAGAGIHNEPVEDGLTVHSLEHGAVVLHYDPNQLSEEEIDQLENIFITKLKGKKIMMPRTDMTKPIIMTSWGQILKLDSIDEEQMALFTKTHNDNGPEKSSHY